MPFSVFIRKRNPLCKKADFLSRAATGVPDFLNRLHRFPSIYALFRHFERSEKSIDSSFTSLRMTAVVFGGFTVSS
ncbi:MAG: hypothetical protein IJ566_00465 [Cardiobacteriaceae bacterium]|nr:hypothetical protein [Cardiobacteriaceae bacterium]